MLNPTGLGCVDRMVETREKESDNDPTKVQAAELRSEAGGVEGEVQPAMKIWIQSSHPNEHARDASVWVGSMPKAGTTSIEFQNWKNGQYVEVRLTELEAMTLRDKLFEAHPVASLPDPMDEKVRKVIEKLNKLLEG